MALGDLGSSLGSMDRLKSPTVNKTVSSTTRDPSFSSVTLLVLNDNAPNGTTTFLDQSSSAKTITRHFGAIYDNSTAPTGMTTSGKFVASGPDFISAADDISLRMGSSDFTIEYMLKADLDASENSYMVNKDTTAATQAVLFYRATDNTLACYVSSDNATWDIASNKLLGTIVVADGWKHAAVCRVGSNWYAFLGGLQGSTWTSSATVSDNAASFNIGAAQDGQSPITAHIACVRVTKGVGRYTANFTPPTLPFPTS